MKGVITMEGICKCALCDHEFEAEDIEEIEELLWGHIQMDHEEEFEKIQNLETPYMIAGYYDYVGVVFMLGD